MIVLTLSLIYFISDISENRSYMLIGFYSADDVFALCMIVLIHSDILQVIQKLHTLFSGYSDMPPTCFVFCGHFTTQPYGTEHVRILKGFFELDIYAVD